MNDDRRHYSRIAFRTAGKLVLPERKVDLLVLDLSLKGALVKPVESLPLVAGTQGVLHVQLSDGEQIKMDVQLTHVEAATLGLVCLSIDLDSVTHLRRLVELNLGAPDLLERELSTLCGE